MVHQRGLSKEVRKDTSSMTSDDSSTPVITSSANVNFKVSSWGVAATDHNNQFSICRKYCSAISTKNLLYHTTNTRNI